MLIDADGEGSRTAALRLLDRISDAASFWDIRVLEYPAQEAVLFDMGLVA
jgi:hypothetical protein